MRLGDRPPIDRELQFHLSRLVETLAEAGMSPEEAQAEAARRFGDSAHYGAECAAVWRDERGRDVREGIMASIKQDIGYGLRTLTRAPAFAVVVIVTLALGIGANTAIFSVVNGVLMRPLGLLAPDRLVVLWEHNPVIGVDATPTSIPMLQDWREGVESLESLAAWQWRSFTLEDPVAAVVLQGVEVSGNYFPTLGVVPQLGRLLDESDEVARARGAVAVISDGLWRSRFGGASNVLGTVLRIDDGSVEIVGVMPPNHIAPSAESDLWLPVGFGTTRPNYGVRALHTVGRLAPGATVDQVSQEAGLIAERIAVEYPQMSQSWTARAVPFRENVVGSVRSSLLIAFASVGLLLLIACVNIANLLLARAAAREREIAIRTALGAGRGRIARQLLTESVMLALVGGLVGVGVAFAAHRTILALEPGVLPRVQEIRLDWWVMAFAVGLSLATGVIFGLLPSLQASTVRLTAVLKEAGGRGSTASGHHRVRRTLVVGQLALTLVLLSGAGLLARTFLELRSVDPGFEAEGVAAARIFLDGRRYSSDEEDHLYYETLLSRIRELPGVSFAGASSSLPMDPVAVNFDLPFRTEESAGTEGAEVPQADFRVVTPGYFESLRVALLRGRFFDQNDRTESAPVVLINRTMAEQHWAGQDPVGRRIETVFGGWRWYEIVGVVADTRYYGLDSEPRPEMYVAEAQSAFGSMTVTARTTGSALALVPLLRAAVTDVDPLQPAQSVFVVEELVSASIAAERFYATLLGAFALVAMVLAGAGIYGVLSFWVSQRTQEIGVRLALGARRGQVVRLVVGSGMAVAIGGVLLGLVGAFATTRLLSGMLFGVHAQDPVTLGGVAVVLALAALLACLAPAVRASRLDPVAALREE